jgi:hypothetical protein
LAKQKFCVNAHDFTNAMPVGRFTLSTRLPAQRTVWKSVR